MDNRLDNLYITIVESSRAKYFAVTDGDIESLAEFTDNPTSMQNALNKALAGYKDMVKRADLNPAPPE